MFGVFMAAALGLHEFSHASRLVTLGSVMAFLGASHLLYSLSAPLLQRAK
jgi:hypothetical protein